MTTNRILLSATLTALSIFGCAQPTRDTSCRAPIITEPFGTTDNRQVNLYTLTNPSGMELKLTNYGASVVSLKTPDRNGDFADIVLGYDTLAEYVADNSRYFGGTIGRCANMISKAKFTLNAAEYTLAANYPPNHLHGGTKGFNKVVWNARPAERDDGPAVEFSYFSPDGQEGYPGNLDVTVTYTLTDENELRIEYRARTDAPTPVSLTNHTYFNLSGHDSGDITDHVLTINADKFTPAGKDFIPTGEIEPVKGTLFDFTEPLSIGARIGQIQGGYDLNYVLNKNGRRLTLAARLCDPLSSRTMEIYTTDLGLQLYTSNELARITGKSGATYDLYDAICLEDQHFPDSINNPHFPTTILTPNQTYKKTTIYKFQTK